MNIFEITVKTAGLLVKEQIVNLRAKPIDHGLFQLSGDSIQ